MKKMKLIPALILILGLILNMSGIGVWASEPDALRPDETEMYKSVGASGRELSAEEEFSARESPVGATIVIGDQYGMSEYVPLFANYNYSLTQQIYLAEELGFTGTIAFLTFYRVDGDSDRNVEIYLHQTDKTEFESETDFVAMTDADLVYDGALHISDNEAVTVKLDRLFEYNGTQNLLLCVVDKTGDWTYQYPNFRATSTEGRNSSLITCTDDREYDVKNISDYSGELLQGYSNLGITQYAETTGMTMIPESCEPYVGDVQALTVQVTPDDATDKAVYWSLAQDNEVLELYEDEACSTPIGDEATDKTKVYAKCLWHGSATVTATSRADSGLTASCDVSVQKTHVISPASFTIGVNHVKKITAIVTPDDRSVSWSVAGGDGIVELYEDEECTIPVGEVTNAHTVYAKSMAAGTAMVNVASSSEPDLSASCLARVKEEAYASVTLTAGNVWGDSSGYQMLLDEDADTFGRIIPENGPLGEDVSSEVYDEFEYKIPEDADGSLLTGHIVLDDSVTILIPAGIYDYCITNPTPGDKMWIASESGSAGGRGDDVEFLAGHSYTYTVYYSDAYDQDVTDLTDSPAVTEPMPNRLFYNGREQELVSEGSANGGILVYALGTDEATPPGEDLYSETIPVAVDVGTYYVWYIAKGDDDHNDSLPQCVTATIHEADPSFKTVSVKLGGKLGLNFFIDLPEIEGISYDNSYVDFSVNGRELCRKTIDWDSRNEDGYYKFTADLNAIQMADKVSAVFHYIKEGEDATQAYEYSIKDYVLGFEEANAKKPFDEKAVALVHAMADYGHYAQVYLSDAKGWTIGTDYAAMDVFFSDPYTEEEISEAVSGLENYGFRIVNNSRDIAGYGMSLSLDSNTAFNLIVKTAEGYTGAVTAKVGGKDANVRRDGKGRYRLSALDIAAHRLGDYLRYEIATENGTATVNTSVLHFVKRMLGDGTGESKQRDAAVAIYRYYKAADNFRNG